MNDLSSSLPVRVRTMQIIAAALNLGVLSFLGIVLFLVQQQPPPAPAMPIVSLVGVAVLVSNIALALFLPPLIAQGGLRRLAASSRPAGMEGDTGGLLAIRQTTLIIVLALFEAAAFLGCVAYLIEGSPIGLGVTVAAVLIMLFNFPTEGSVGHWLQQQEQRLTGLRHQAGAGTRLGR